MQIPRKAESFSSLSLMFRRDVHLQHAIINQLAAVKLDVVTTKNSTLLSWLWGNIFEIYKTRTSSLKPFSESKINGNSHTVIILVWEDIFLSLTKITGFSVSSSLLAHFEHFQNVLKECQCCSPCNAAIVFCSNVISQKREEALWVRISYMIMCRMEREKKKRERMDTKWCGLTTEDERHVCLLSVYMPMLIKLHSMGNERQRRFNSVSPRSDELRQHGSHLLRTHIAQSTDGDCWRRRKREVRTAVRIVFVQYYDTNCNHFSRVNHSMPFWP